MYRLYRFLIPLYFTGIRIAGFFRRDARKWVEGRSGWYDTLDRFISSLSGHSQKRIWIHVSSLGEFEQGREVLEAIKDGHPEAVVILSFFSPSGYDKRKDYPLADYVCYFPSDRYSTMQSFIGKMQPDLALFVKYDFWFNCLHLLNQRNIPFVYFSLALRKNHFLLHPLSHSLLDKLRPAKQLFVQNQETFDLLKDHGFQNISLSGDTRVDRVCRIAEERGVDPLILSFCGAHKILIGGSIWPGDLDQITPALLKALQNGWKLILVPHVPDEKHLSDLEKRFPAGSIRYSGLTESDSGSVLLIDRIGLLASLYQIGHLAYVGGGFGKGIHSILEPAAHHIPVCFGPKHHKFPEAGEFIERGIGRVIRNPDDLDRLIRENLVDQDSFQEAVRLFFSRNQGSSEQIYQYLHHQQLLS